jgi:hypothetical protein
MAFGMIVAMMVMVVIMVCVIVLGAHRGNKLAGKAATIPPKLAAAYWPENKKTGSPRPFYTRLITTALGR